MLTVKHTVFILAVAMSLTACQAPYRSTIGTYEAKGAARPVGVSAVHSATARPVSAVSARQSIEQRLDSIQRTLEALERRDRDGRDAITGYNRCRDGCINGWKLSEKPKDQGEQDRWFEQRDACFENCKPPTDSIAWEC